jgi:hypothetical protein
MSLAREDHTTTPRWRARAKNCVLRLRERRARSGGAPGRAQPVGNAQRARRRLAGLARRAGSGRGKCT